MTVPVQAWFSGLFYNHWYVHESSFSLGTSILECLMLLLLLSSENSWNQNTFIERGSFYSSYDVVMITWSWLVVYASKGTFSGLYLDLKYYGLSFYASICFIVTICMENLARQWLMFIFVSEFLLRQRWWLHCLHIWLDCSHYNWPRFTLRLSKKNCSKHLLSLVLVWSAYTLNIQAFGDVLAVLHITSNFSILGSSSKLEDGLLHLSQYSDLMEQRVIALIWIIFGLCFCILCSSFEDASVMNSSSLILSFVELYVAPEASHIGDLQKITFGSLPRPPESYALRFVFGVYLHMLWNIDGVVTTLGSIRCMIWLCSTCSYEQSSQWLYILYMFVLLKRDSEGHIIKFAIDLDQTF